MELTWLSCPILYRKQISRYNLFFCRIVFCYKQLHNKTIYKISLCFFAMSFLLFFINESYQWYFFLKKEWNFWRKPRFKTCTGSIIDGNAQSCGNKYRDIPLVGDQLLGQPDGVHHGDHPGYLHLQVGVHHGDHPGSLYLQVGTNQCCITGTFFVGICLWV